MGFFDYRVSLSPPWMLGQNGLSWSSGFGQEEDAFQQRITYGVQDRYPDKAPMDIGGTTSQALAYIGNDRQLLPTFGDTLNLDKTRAWIKSGFSPNPAGATLPWLPNATYAQNASVSTGTQGIPGPSLFVGGLVWTCTTAGTSGTDFPFPQTAQLGQSVTDGTAVWAWNGTTISQVPSNTAPPNPAAPGWYYAGTDLGLIAALVNSGFYAIDAGGNVIPPRIYVNRDWYSLSVVETGAGTGVVGLVGDASSTVSLTATVNTSGTVGTSGEVAVVATTGAPTWAASTAYVAGQFVTSAHGDVFYCSTSGTSGTTNPFPGSTPSPSTYPPTAGAGISDGSAGWTFATFSPIPAAIPVGVGAIIPGGAPLSVGSAYALTFSGTFTATDSYAVVWTPVPPDGHGEAWSRLWLVLPATNLLNTQLTWGSDAGWKWGGPPSGDMFPVQWGASGQTSGASVAGLLTSIVNRWLSAHVRFIGAWLAPGTSTELDTPYPSPPWNELFATIDGNIVPFFRANSEL